MQPIRSFRNVGSTSGITPWGRKFRVRVWIPKRGYKHIGLYPTIEAAMTAYQQNKSKRN